MKAKRKVDMDDDLRREYDFSKLKAGVRGKYVGRYRKGTNLIRLDRDVAAAFADDTAVNQTLRAALKLSEAVRSKARSSNKRVERTRG